MEAAVALPHRPAGRSAAPEDYAPPSLLQNPAIAALLFLLLTSSSVVLFEPAPYDVMAVAIMFTVLLCGMALSPAVAPLLIVVILFIASGFLAATQGRTEDEPFFYVTVTAFLAFNAVFFAFVVATHPVRAFNLIMAGYLVAALITAIAAIGGYFDVLPESETFTRFGRAKGTFKDPNVMGPFLVPPSLFLLNRILRSDPLTRLPEVGMLLILLAAIFLSFSRGAWGHLLLSFGIFVFLVFITARTLMTRMRILVLVTGGVMAVAALIAWATTIDDVRVLLIERAQLTQSYDVGAGGRFARQIAGFASLAELPLGYGPRNFGNFFGEDPHNVYLKAFAAYGWLAGLAYLGLVITTLVYGAKLCVRRTPWQAGFQIAYASFVGLAVLGLIIDTDRWRHFWLLVGILWGMMAAYGPYLRATSDRSLHRQRPTAIDEPGRSVAQPG